MLFPLDDPQHREGLAAIDARTPDQWDAFLHFRAKRLPDPGAGNLALETLGLSEYAPCGSATAVRGAQPMRPVQPMIYMYGAAVPVTGIQGVSAGSFVGQPLSY